MANFVQTTLIWWFILEMSSLWNCIVFVYKWNKLKHVFFCFCKAPLSSQEKKALRFCKTSEICKTYEVVESAERASRFRSLSLFRLKDLFLEKVRASPAPTTPPNFGSSYMPPPATEITSTAWSTNHWAGPYRVRSSIFPFVFSVLFFLFSVFLSFIFVALTHFL